ncbi:MAG TPA: MFS transporter [Candidatus Bathyarchaeia archaeon]|nr:MFS transporter [Candidatus Bathyarchaeia archaeon]
MALLKSGQRIAYSVARFGTSIFMNIVTLALFYIYDKEFGLAEDSNLNAIALAVGKVVIGFSSFIFGYISDILKPSKIGRRKIFIWTGAPLLAFSFIMLMTPNLLIPSAGVTGVFVWLLIWNAFFNLFYGYLLTPYQSWMAEVTTSDDRLLTSGLQNTTNVLSTLFGIGFAFLLPGLLNLDEGLNFTNSMILLGVILGFAIIEVGMFLPSLIMIKEENIERKERNVWREFKIVLSNKNYVIWFIAQGIYSMGLTIINSLVIVFSDDILGFTEFYQTLIFGLSVFITLILCFLAWGKIASKIGKKWSLIIGFGLLVIVLPFSMIFKILPASWLEWAGYIYGFLIGVGLSAPYLFPYAIIADIAAKDEENTGEPRAGMYNGFNSIPLNICQALAFLMVGFLNKEGANFRLYWFGLFAALFILLAIPVLYFGNFDPYKGKKITQDKTITQNDIAIADKTEEV